MENEKDRIIEELRRLNSSLSSWKEQGKSEGFKLPEGYFEELQQALKTKLNEPKPAPRIVKIPSRRWLSVAASVLVVLLAGWYYFGPETNESTLEPSRIELANYVQDHLDDFELELLSKYVFQQQTPGMQLLPTKDPFETEEMDELIDDLIDEVDLSTLEELL